MLNICNIKWDLHSSWSLAVTVRTVCWMSSFSSTSASYRALSKYGGLSFLSAIPIRMNFVTKILRKLVSNECVIDSLHKDFIFDLYFWCIFLVILCIIPSHYLLLVSITDHIAISLMRLNKISHWRIFCLSYKLKGFCNQNAALQLF